jgi:hypothetical protein
MRFLAMDTRSDCKQKCLRVNIGVPSACSVSEIVGRVIPDLIRGNLTHRFENVGLRCANPTYGSAYEASARFVS